MLYQNIYKIFKIYIFPRTAMTRYARSSFLASQGWSFEIPPISPPNLLGIYKNVSSWLHYKLIFDCHCSLSVKWFVTEHKNKKNVLANVCNIWINFKTRNNSKQMTY